VIYVLLLAGQFYALNVATRKLLRLEHEREGLVEGLKIATEDANRDRARASSAGRTKSQFLSNMNHELRTPMNAILGFSELIKNKSFGAAIDKYAEYAGIIHESGQHLLSLIDDMLDLAKIESGRVGLRESEINIAHLIGDAVQTSEDTARASQISLSKSLGPGLPRIWADERALRQIFVNLLSNSLKFTPSGGCVVAFARAERGGRIAFGVEDTGIGISTDDQPNVFERFGRSRHDITTTDRGTGLGLAIVKGFAEAHDGEVKLESTLGAGTRVTVYLPIERTRLDQLKAAG
jgi:two-component system cell cycle sensor histidine kinase PleC